MYVALNLDGYKTKLGFISIQDAETYISTHVCMWCKQEFDRGYYLCDTDVVCILSVLETPCGSNWKIITKEDFDMIY